MSNDIVRPNDWGLFDHASIRGARKRLLDYCDEAIYRFIRARPIPYLWGGQRWGGYVSPHHPAKYGEIEGADCSGFVILGLIHAGILTAGFDATAAGLYNHFPRVPIAEAKPGDLAFFGGTPSHVAILWQPFRATWVMVEAAGGSSGCTSVAEAQRRKAYVGPSLLMRRNDRRDVVAKVVSE